jgi:hypothetical protein
MGEGRKVYKVLARRPEGKGPLGRPRCRWEDGIKMDLQVWSRGRVEWIHLAQVADSCEHGDEPSGSGSMEIVALQSLLQFPSGRFPRHFLG